MTVVELGRSIESAVGVVAAEPPAASEAGARMLAAGGNAMDAAAAAALACCVARPEMTGIAGYLLAAVVHEGGTGRTWSLDSNSVAPAAAHPAMYEVLPVRSGPEGINENEYLCSVAEDANLYGGHSVGVPGVLAGIGTLSERWGSLPWRTIVEPSLALVDGGIPYTAPVVEALTQMSPVLAGFPATTDVLMPSGLVPAVGEMWHRPDMAGTLDRLGDSGWRDHYDGDMARRIVECVRADGGVLTLEDLAAFEPRVTDPLRISCGHAEVFAPILPNGSLTSLQILGQLACFPTSGSADDRDVAYWHRLVEILKSAWRDRLATLGDPAFTDVDVARILSRDDALRRTAALRADPFALDESPLEATDSRPGTLHLSTADAAGNVVAVTLTHGAPFGSCLTVPGTGVILGHGMSRLDPRPGRPNSVAAGKRPLNNVAPLITRTGDRVVATGLPGGRRIVSVGAQLAARVIDREESLLDTVAAPRVHVTHVGVEVTDGIHVDVVDGLRQLGHHVQVLADVGGGAQAAEFDSSKRITRAAGSKGVAAAP